MDPLAKKALERLLRSADRQEAGVAVRQPALTASALADYRGLRSLKAKEEFEAVMQHAQAVGAIRVVRPKFESHGFIERVDLVDAEALAQVLGRETNTSRVDRARKSILARCSDFPALEDVLQRWETLKKARGTGPEAFGDWLAACDVIEDCRSKVNDGASEIPVRDASARLFKDSKRIEQLVPLIDALLCGSLDELARPVNEVLQELGLFREEQPVRMAGMVCVRRERGAFVLDRPYCALPPSTILGLGSQPTRVLTIENLTTFHVQARSVCDSNVLCIYTGGMPSPSWRRMYVDVLRDLSGDVLVHHWGDVDEGGYRIAAFISRAAAESGKQLLPWRMHPDEVPMPQRRDAPTHVVARMANYAREAGWPEVALAIERSKFFAEQEGQ